MSEITICDPACGSGSFLLGAYQFLLDWHKTYYAENLTRWHEVDKTRGHAPLSSGVKSTTSKNTAPLSSDLPANTFKGKLKDNPLTPEGNLTTAEKKRILVNNIYGVDIDSNAVEVTKLSLLLKCLEGETEASISQQIKLFTGERILPTLENNILSGNSLIDFDFYDNNLDFGEEKKIKPFSWQKSFPKVFKDKEVYEELGMFHITCVMHNSRVSKRMEMYEIRPDNPEFLSIYEEEKLVEIIANHIKDYKLKITNFNICGDHIHFAIVCKTEELTNIVGRLKSISSREFNLYRGITRVEEKTRGHEVDKTRGHEVDKTRGHAPLSSAVSTSVSKNTTPFSKTRGETQNSLWAQKFNRIEIINAKQYYNVGKYIDENRYKHDLIPLSKNIVDLINSSLTPYSEAFKPTIIKGGFDAVIGNPPWVDIKGMNNELVKFFFYKYKTTENRINLYSIFIEKSLSLINNTAYLSFIIPNSLLYQSSYSFLRKYILDNSNIETIVRLPDNVFQNVKAETMVITLNKSAKETNCIIYKKDEVIERVDESLQKLINISNWYEDKLNVYDIYSNKSINLIMNKIESNKVNKLVDICDFTLGLTPYDKYRGHTPEMIENKIFHSKTKQNETFKPLLKGGDVNRYTVKWSGEDFISYGDWLGAPRQGKFFLKPRILIRQILSGNPLKIYAGYTDEELYNSQTIFNLILKDNIDFNIKYLLALINSNLINFYHSYKYLDISKNLFQKILIQNCKLLPIKTIDFSNKQEKDKHDKIVELVDTLLQLNKEIQDVSLESKKTQIKNKIQYCEDKIDQLVYELYELTAEEIRIVEGE